LRDTKADLLEYRPAAGRRADPLSVIALCFLGLFVVIVLALVAADVAYLGVRKLSLSEVWGILASADVSAAIRRSVVTSLITLALVILFSVPVGYALSRYRFPGHALVDTVVDVPIVLPPVVIGVSLLAFFGTPLGNSIKQLLRAGTGWTLTSAIGIVLCQFLVSVSYSIRATKASFDSVDRRLEHVALTLGCSRWGAFWRVSLPLARNGLIAGSVMAWARAIGVFGPLMVFVGTSPRVMVMPTNVWLELSVGNIEVSLAVALVMLVMAGAALAVVHWLAGGTKWWGV
jgi:molybdate transport system permease protein